MNRYQVALRHRYEGGWTRFSLTTLCKIAEALNADLEVALVPRHPGQIEPGTKKKLLTGDLVKILSPLFWDKPMEETDLHKYPIWVLRRVLTSGTDAQVKATVDYFGTGMIRTVLEHRDVDAKTRAFWNAVLVRGTRLSFLKLEAPLNHPGTPYRGLTVADPSDIATLKLVAIAGRGSRKDFIDLYVYFQNAPGLEHLLTLLEQRDPMIDWNRYHILKSLSYFEDAENEPLPNMLQKIDWETVMSYFRDIARQAF